MSAPDRRAMVERSGKDLSVRRQCALVGVARSGIYRPKPVAGADDLAVMRRIDDRFAWTTPTRCPHTHSRSSKKRLDS